MSYILDALRRADAERSRGAVPGLHSQGLPTDGEPAARNYTPLLWAAGAAGVLLAAGVGVLLWAPWRGAAPTEARAAAGQQLVAATRDGTPVQPAQGELPPSQPGAIDPGARPVEPPIGRGNPMPTTSGEVAPPPAYPPPATARPSARDTLAERAAAGRVATLQPRADARAPVATPAPAPTSTQPPVEHYGAPAEPTPAPAPAPARAAAIPPIGSLPPDVRAQLPHLAVGGAIYSEVPSARMVILNGQVFHEGDKPAVDTVLELIRLKSAVLNFRGQRYEISY